MTSLPPVLDPDFAAAHDLEALRQYSRAKRIAVPTTTISTPATPSIIEPPAQHRWCFSCGAFVFDPHWVDEEGGEAPACWECAAAYRDMGRRVR